MKTLNIVLATALFCLAGLGVLQALNASPSPTSKWPEVLLFAGFAITGLIWLVLTFRPSLTGRWLLYASALSAIWLNSVAYLGTRDEQGFASATTGEWLRVGLGAVVLLTLLGLAVRAHLRSRRAASQA